MNDATKVFSSSLTYFLYADDLKICRIVHTIRDAIALQRDLGSFLKWCVDNELFLNINKCNVISFTRKKSFVEFTYMFEAVVLKRVREVRDLGVLMDAKLTIAKHVEAIVAKSYSMLGFMMRLCKNFRSAQTLKSIYCAHVRSHLEYASMVRHPYQDTYIDKIESIQKKFVIYALRRSIRRDRNFRLPSYLSRCESIGIESLARRRINSCTYFVFDLLNGRYDAPNIRSLLVINNPVRLLRNANYLRVDRHRTEYGRYELKNNMCIRVTIHFLFLFY